MKFLDKIALNRLIQILTNFILAVLKLCNPPTVIDKPKPKRPLRDLLDKVWKK